MAVMSRIPTLHVRLLVKSAALACVAVAVAASPRDASGQECVPNDTVVVALSRTDTGASKIVDGCWMPKVADVSKILCAHDPELEHTFTFELKNTCALAVKLTLTVKRNTIDFKGDDCDIEKGKILFEGFLAENGGAVSRTCATRKHNDKKQRRGSYDLVATHVRSGGVETKLTQAVTFDPEIILEEKGKHGILWWGALVLIAGAAAYAIYRMFLRKE
jgi:hypothetical protein